MTGPPPIALWSLALAAGLVLFNAGLSVAFHLGLARTLVVAATRMVVQLALIALILVELFALKSPWLTLLAGLVMVGFAGREVMARQARRLRGPWGYGVGTATMLVASFAVLMLALTTQVRPDPWYDPRYAIPLLGMILGNMMNGVALGVDALTGRMVDRRGEIEARLTLGASRWTALSGIIRDALRAGFTPIINAMSAAGIVFLPGMMTGQILAGADPAVAVRYQILIMFLIAGGTGLGTLIAVFGAAWRLTDDRHRLRLERLYEGRRR